MREHSRRLVLHVGPGKTGTSSLQHFLCAAPPGLLGDAGYAYCVVGQDGSVLRGAALRGAAQATALGYLASTPELWRQRADSILREELEAVWDEGLTPVLSQEAWHFRALQFAEGGLLRALRCPVDVVAYVRPQVDWLNAAWWQWFAWDGAFAGPGEVVAARGHSMYRWGSQLRRWLPLLAGGRLRARLYGKDTLGDFLGLLGVPPSPEVASFPRLNAGLVPSLIAFYRAVPGLRTVHGAELDSRLRRWFDGGGRLPWAVDRALAESVVAALREDNELLAGFLDEPQQALMRADPRWWSVLPWEARFGEPPEPPRMGAEQARALARELGL